MIDDVQEILFSEEQLRQRVQELGAQITKDYAGKAPVLASVLRGSYIFMADLTRAIQLPIHVDFMAVSSYGSGTKSSGQVQITKDLSDDIEGRDLIIVEDILDSGNTLYYLMQILQAGRPPPSGCARCWISRSAAPSPLPPITAASPFRTPSWWAMAWIMRKSTGTCLISAF